MTNDPQRRRGFGHMAAVFKTKVNKFPLLTVVCACANMASPLVHSWSEWPSLYCPYVVQGQLL